MDFPSGWLPPLSSTNAVDWLLVAIVLLGALGGWRRGFVATSLQLLTLAVSLTVALAGYAQPAAWLQGQFRVLGDWAPPLAFVAIFVILYAALASLAGRAIGALPRTAHAHAGNRLLGLAPGVVNGLINAVAVAVLLLAVPAFDGLTRLARDSAIASRLSAPAEWLQARLAPIFEQPIRRTLHALIVPVESKASVPLPFRVTQAHERPELEARMLEMVNAERLQRGLKPLQADPELTQVARAHSRDMFARSYFSHVSPDRDDPFDRMREARVRYLVAGENLALARTLPAAHRGLMESPGHRANILRPQFGRAGIGVLDGGVHGLMVTQNFRN
ncbi:MAG TPA: CvpA family protein [Ramlibacter sp.]